jgi:hypothetical protein
MRIFAWFHVFVCTNWSLGYSQKKIFRTTLPISLLNGKIKYFKGYKSGIILINIDAFFA